MGFKNRSPNSFGGTSGVSPTGQYSTSIYKVRALDALASLGGAGATDLARELGVSAQHALAVIAALEEEGLVKYKNGRFEIKEIED